MDKKEIRRVDGSASIFGVLILWALAVLLLGKGIKDIQDNTSYIREYETKMVEEYGEELFVEKDWMEDRSSVPNLPHGEAEAWCCIYMGISFFIFGIGSVIMMFVKDNNAWCEFIFGLGFFVMGTGIPLVTIKEIGAIMGIMFVFAILGGFVAIHGFKILIGRLDKYHEANIFSGLAKLIKKFNK